MIKKIEDKAISPSAALIGAENLLHIGRDNIQGRGNQ